MKNKWLTGLTWLGVGLAAGVGFWLSYDVLKFEAEQAGVNKNLSWLIPVAIDGAAFFFTIYIVDAVKRKNKLMEKWGYGVVIAVTAISVALNFFHADKWQDAIFFVIPPVILGVAIHCLAMLVSSNSELEWSSFEEGLNTMKSKLNNAKEKMNGLATSLNIPTGELNSVDDVVNAVQSKLSESAEEMNTVEARLKTAETKIAELELLVDRYEPSYRQVEIMNKKMNGLAIDVLGIITKSHDMTQAQIVQKHGVSAGKVSGLKKSLNGAG